VIAVGVVDDHMIVQDGIRAMAERTHGFAFWGGASSSRELLQMLEQSVPEVLLLDLRIASDNGFDLCRIVSKRFPPVRVVVFTAHGSATLLRESVAAGAVGYILKDASTRRLPDVVRRVHELGSYFDPRLSEEFVMAAAPSNLDWAGPKLNERDMLVLRMIVQGRTNSEIAEALHFSYHTIKLCVSGLLDKFGVKRRTELARIAIERQLI
jgi:two-component system, NarL family, response regulator DevR